MENEATFGDLATDGLWEGDPDVPDSAFLTKTSETSETLGPFEITRTPQNRSPSSGGVKITSYPMESYKGSPRSPYVSTRSTYGSNGSYHSAQSTYGSNGSYLSTQSAQGSARSYWSARSSHLTTDNFESNELGVLPESPKASLFALKLTERDILQPPNKELDWSGRGQHVEYSTQNSGEIPLERIDYLGHSATAIVESVRCTRGRRVKMARKSIRCSRRMTMDEVLVEVEALQKLNHPHIIQLVGSYLLEDCLSILLYPVADCHLGTFMQRHRRLHFYPEAHQFNLAGRLTSCLTQAVLYVHSKNFKHGDIKPQNILIRYESDQDYVNIDSIRLYLSDFGIARKFKDESYTKDDSVTALSKVYCAPEVYDGQPWGRSADLFSLGCVLLEIELAFHHSERDLNDFVRAREAADCPFAPGSYFGNLGLVRERISTLPYQGKFNSIGSLLALLEEKPEARVIHPWLKYLKIECCKGPREIYEFDES